MLVLGIVILIVYVLWVFTMVHHSRAMDRILEELSLGKTFSDVERLKRWADTADRISTGLLILAIILSGVFFYYR